VSGFLEGLLGLSPVWIYLAVAALVFAEDAIFVGFVIPGETAAVLAGVAASLGRTNLAASILVVVVAAIVGDTVGYEVGKHVFGPKVLDGRLLGKHRHKLARAEKFLQKRGGSAVFLGRFTAFFRAMMPALAGASGMPYRTFLIWNAAGGIVWGTLFVTLGHVAGSSYKVVEERVGRGLAIGVVTLVVLAGIAWKIYEARKDRREEREYASEHPAEDGQPDIAGMGGRETA
jgi:membrane protein DedA with SNARE-associated domain